MAPVLLISLSARLVFPTGFANVEVWLRSRLLTRSYSPFILHPCRCTNHPHRVLKWFIETKVPLGTPDSVMAQTGTEKKKEEGI
jgi:hypothetical protein